MAAPKFTTVASGSHRGLRSHRWICSSYVPVDTSYIYLYGAIKIIPRIIFLSSQALSYGPASLTHPFNN